MHFSLSRLRERAGVRGRAGQEHVAANAGR